MLEKRTLTSAMLAIVLLHFGTGACSAVRGNEHLDASDNTPAAALGKDEAELLQTLERSVWEVTPWQPFFEWKASEVVAKTTDAVVNQLQSELPEMVQSQANEQIKAAVLQSLEEPIANIAADIEEKLKAFNENLDRVETTVSEAVVRQTENARSADTTFVATDFENAMQRLSALESSTMKQAVKELEAMLPKSETRVEATTSQLIERMEGERETHQRHAKSVAELRAHLGAVCESQKCSTEKCGELKSECQLRADEIVALIEARRSEAVTAMHTSENTVTELKAQMEELTQSTDTLQRNLEAMELRKRNAEIRALALRNFGIHSVTLTLPTHNNHVYSLKPLEFATHLATFSGGRVQLSEHSLQRYAAVGIGTVLDSVLFNTNADIAKLLPLCTAWLLSSFSMDVNYARCQVSADGSRLVVEFSNRVVSNPPRFRMEVVHM